MKILVIGSGGREHAIIKKLKENPRVTEIFAAPGNGGISMDASCIDIKATDIQGVVGFAVKNAVDLVVVAPDDPLVLGMVDALEAQGIRAFGPRANAAIIEGSKAFSKSLMQKYNIPTAQYAVFDNSSDACAYVKAQNTYPTVIKADGLALGKGVIIAKDYDEAAQAIHAIMNDKIFGDSGNHLIVEEFLTGPEVSVLAFTDSKTVVPMVSSMDHKRALDGDQGRNTGGMGTIAPNPFYTKEIEKICMDTIFLPTIQAMSAEGRPFQGCLYFGLMLTKDGPKVIEYNARFGDPETQVVLPLLKTDLLTIFEAIIDKRLDTIHIEWSHQSAACVIMASGGYPGKYATGITIQGLDQNGQVDGATVFHAGTRFNQGFQTAGGRVLGLTATGNDLKQALTAAYAAAEKIHFDGAHMRRDIGKRALSI